MFNISNDLSRALGIRLKVAKAILGSVILAAVLGLLAVIWWAFTITPLFTTIGVLTPLVLCAIAWALGEY